LQSQASTEPECVAIEQAQREVLVSHPRPAVEQLVAAAPQHDTSSGAQTANDRSGFLIEHPQVGGAAFVITAGQREFLPDHEAKLVTQIKERILLYRGATPAAQEIEVGIVSGLQERLYVSAVRRPGKISGLTQLEPLAKMARPLISRVIGGLLRLFGN